MARLTQPIPGETLTVSELKMFYFHNNIIIQFLVVTMITVEKGEAEVVYLQSVFFF